MGRNLPSVDRRKTPMKNLTRRSFVSRAAAAGTTMPGLLAGATGVEAQLVWRASEWKRAEFHKLVRDPAKIKQVYDVVPIGDGTFLNGMKNSLMACNSDLVFLRSKSKW
jgi:hypothetical protein